MARVKLGRDYLLDAELMAAARALGAERVTSEGIDPPRLALLG